ncbi:hypothetical protein DCAR_0414906 [Daucus carota subsp. sativus]|uniref:Uncharacterized protein n=1 Tax=Daucus carota subsp. sativus TaxID=79200 RepID=A0AAF1AWZ9_DAUCS|nr:hypothetical protein DCAR_0414906 [Daucus carota subsp. sativus]
MPSRVSIILYLAQTIISSTYTPATLKYCNSPCECHEKCKIGLPICFHHVCGCVDHALYKLPDCPQI